MPALDIIYSFVLENLENVSLSRAGTHFHCKCPFCGDSKKSDKKKRFHLQYKSDDEIYFNCFNCYEKGNFYDLYAHVKGITSKEAYKELNRFSEKNILNSLKKTSKLNSPIKKKSLSKFDKFLKEECLSLTSIPEGIVQTNLINKLKDFKSSRKIDTDIFICYTGKFKNRIIIPIFNNGSCVYFQGRSIKENQLPKYLNPVAEKESVILNKDNFVKDNYIIVTEGILDALSIGNQGTACLGAFIKDDFIKELLKFTNKGIIIALDNDITGRERTDQILHKSKYKKLLNYFFLEEFKDLNEKLVASDDINIYKYVVENKLDYLSAYSYISLKE